MKISPLHLNIKQNIVHTEKNPNTVCYFNMPKDTVSFSASFNNQKVKKSDFKGIDFATIEKYRIDISNFDSADDLQKWADDRISKLQKTDFKGRQGMTRIQRESLFKEWNDYLTKENDAYTPVMKFAILDAIIADLKSDNDAIPPVLDKGVLADTMDEATERFNINPKENINIKKLYQTKLFESFISIDEDGKSQTDYSGWIVIPSEKHDPNHFKENVNKLKVLSHKRWCTKSFNAEPYLKKGDFHVYLEKGKPKLGVRFVDNKIQEIQGELNDGKIPHDYLDIVEKHIADLNNKVYKKVLSACFKMMNLNWDFLLSNLEPQAEMQLNSARKIKKRVKKIKQEVGENALKNADVEKILPYFDIKVRRDKKDGKYIIFEYGDSKNDIYISDLNIDENKMFENIKEIAGKALFKNTNVTNLGALKKISGHAIFTGSKVTDLGQLEKIGGDAVFCHSQITDLKNLKYIGGDAAFGYSQIKSLENLRSIMGNLELENSNIKDIGKLRYIGECANFENAEITDLKELRIIGKDANFNISKIKNWGQLRKIGGSVDLSLDTTELFHGCRKLEKITDARFDKVKEVFKNITVKGPVICPYYPEYNK